MPAEDPIARTIAILALTVSFLSFLVSFSSLLWNIYVGRRDSVSVKLDVSPAFLYGGGRPKPEGPHVGYQVMNTGRRTVTIIEVGLLGPNGKKLQIWPINPASYPKEEHAPNLPAEIKENEKASYILLGNSLSEYERNHVGEIPLAYVADAVGHTFTAKIPDKALELLWPGGRYQPWWKVWAHSRWKWWRWKAG